MGPAGEEDGEGERGGTSRPAPPPRACADFAHTSAEARAAVLNAQEPGLSQAVASGNWPASSRSTISSS